MTYKPFDLKVALENPERVVTRDGRKVLEIKHFEKMDQKERALYILSEGNSMRRHSINGRYGDAEPHPYDLFLLPETPSCRNRRLLHQLAQTRPHLLTP